MASVMDERPPGLRTRAARGTIVNGAFNVGINALGLLQGVVVASVLAPSVYGRWGMLMAAFMTLLMLGSVGVDDKYIQQDHEDQQRAFEVALTFQLILGGVFVVVIAVGMPLFALLYGNSQIVAPGLALALAIPAIVLQTPAWVYYRRMEYLRQRTLGAIDPVVTFVATISLAIAGLGVWALVLGAIAGTWAAAIAMAASSPYPLRLRWDPAAAREYASFSWPLFVGAISTVVLIQVPVTVGARVLGVSAVAGLALANTVQQFTTKVDEIVTQTLYPAICSVRDRTDLLFESFWKSNRLALLWATPVGIAAALFMRDFTHLVIGDKWRFAVGVIAACGVTALIDQVGFNWTAFFRAIGDTRPIAVVQVIRLVATLVIAIPLMVTHGLTAFGVGLGLAALVGLAARLWYLRRIFPSLPLVRHVLRGIGPTVPAAAAVVALRVLDPAPRSAARVLVEALLFALIAIAATYASERRLLRELLGYLRGGGGAAGQPVPA